MSVEMPPGWDPAGWDAAKMAAMTTFALRRRDDPSRPLSERLIWSEALIFLDDERSRREGEQAEAAWLIDSVWSTGPVAQILEESPTTSQE